MSWAWWLLLGAGVMAVFVVWDLLWCDGRRCREFLDWIKRSR